ncbi:MAG: IcmT/TraK family protein [Deltaproteobacteria bacterium]|jgi:hypothetical protein|nr:IcmT/TraK family protein [Deltaproteobacteria bacterium]
MNAPWAWSAKKARLFFIDARAIFPITLWLLRWSWATLLLAIVSILALALLARRGITLNSAFPLIKAKLVGSEREAFDPRRFRERCRF